MVLNNLQHPRWVLGAQQKVVKAKTFSCVVCFPSPDQEKDDVHAHRLFITAHKQD